MFAAVGGSVGLIYSLCLLIFRWKKVVAKYGSLSLYWWIMAVTIGCTLLGLMVDVAIWGVQYALWSTDP